MAEQLVSNPNVYQGLAVAAIKDGSHAINDMSTMFNKIQEYKPVQGEEGNKVMREDKAVAQEVAYDVKPQVDAIVGLQKRIDNPYASAATMNLPNGETGLIGVEDVGALNLQKQGAEIDLERNAVATVKVAQSLGQVATHN